VSAQRNPFPRRTVGSLSAALLLATVAACSGGVPQSAISVTRSDWPTAVPTSSALPTSRPAPNFTLLDITAIVIPPESAPTGMTLSDDGGGPATLEQLPLFPDAAADLLAAPGFVNGRWTRFAGSEDDFAASKDFILTWVVQYASPSDAEGAFSILLNELQSDDHYGWGIGEDAGLGDAGTCLEGDNPQLGGLHETICMWRHETPIEADAEAMDARAEALLP
jgi:hypothetical protein